MNRQYVTTAIDFPNAAPHMGHVMEKVLADVCARWFRLRGDETRFQIGTDDHGINMQRTAEKLKMHPKDLVLQNAPKFQELFDRLQISYDVFVSTSITPGHYETVQALWKRLQEGGHLEKRVYTGLYCSGCEKFMTKRDLVDGKCPNHQTVPEEVTEENWFFKLHEKEEFLKKLLDPKKGNYRIVPEYRAQEVFSILESGLEDVSFSRSKNTLYWGVPVPGDPEQVIYVWCDNLTNYISTLGYLTASEDKTWWDEVEVTHIIGKDIARFHALNWPAMLHAGKIKTPDRLLIHGFLTSDGQKMSKTLGNVVVPSEVIEKYGVDPLRFYLSHEIPVGRDGDFSWDRMKKLYDSKLRNDTGNLLNRVLVLLQKEGGAPVALSGDDKMIREVWNTYEKSMNEFDYSSALQSAMTVATAGNQYIDVKKVWTLKGEERLLELSILAEYLRHIALLLLPFTPETAQKISRQLGVPYAEEMLRKDFILGNKKEWGSQKDWKRIGEPEILFPVVS